MGFNSKPLLLFIFLSFSITRGDNDLCPHSSCGTRLSDIGYPFILKHQKPGNNCTYFNLTCSTTEGKASVNLPYSGDFNVEYIDYNSRYVQLSDPGNCLMRRLVNFSMLPSCPYKVKNYYNYVLYVCPWESQAMNSTNPIVCLSNSTKATIATTNDISWGIMERYGCVKNGNLSIPSLKWTHMFDPANETFFYLTWDAVVCEDCDKSENDESGDDETKPISKILAIVSSLPILIIIPLSCISMFCLHVIRIITEKQDPAPPEFLPEDRRNTGTTQDNMMPQPSTTVNNGLDESRIMDCTEITVLDEKFLTGGTIACSICLENYRKEDRIRVIIKCEHLFHDECIRVWFGKNGTCPVCRTSLSDGALEHRSSV